MRTISTSGHDIDGGQNGFSVLKEHMKYRYFSWIMRLPHVLQRCIKDTCNQLASNNGNSCNLLHSLRTIESRRKPALVDSWNGRCTLRVRGFLEDRSEVKESFDFLLVNKSTNVARPCDVGFEVFFGKPFSITASKHIRC